MMHAHFGLGKSETPFDYGLAIFCSLNLFNLCGRSDYAVAAVDRTQPNLVKKVVFPA